MLEQEYSENGPISVFSSIIDIHFEVKQWNFNGKSGIILDMKKIEMITAENDPISVFSNDMSLL